MERYFVFLAKPGFRGKSKRRDHSILNIQDIRKESKGLKGSLRGSEYAIITYVDSEDYIQERRYSLPKDQAIALNEVVVDLLSRLLAS